MLEQKTIGFKVAVEVAAQFDAAFSAAQATNPELTRGQFFADMVAGNASTGGGVSTDLQNAAVEYERFKSVFDSYTEAILGLFEIDGSDLTLNEKLDVIHEQVKKLQQRAMTIPSTVEKQIELQENQFIVTMGEFVALLMNETVKRLSDKYGRDIAPAEVLLDMFVRYTVEQNNEWFYPFVLKDSDIKTITGKEPKDLKQLWQKK